MNEICIHKMEWIPMPVIGFEGKLLIEHKNGGLKMVKIMPGSVFPLHQHPDKTEFAYVIEGTLEATIGDTKKKGNTGTFYQFPIGINHSLKNPSETETIVLIGSFSEEK
ncbi:cupin domain-containing protein [Neobacillus sp. BF23-41]|uniref:cupin domain-containing protein n=1 Tax=Neobacillus sp. BF23-41 TaxID=3240280 RepID=UPI0034E5DB61